MFTTPRKSYRGNNSRTPSSTRVRLDGLFENGQWFCNCDPRLPAVRLQVKKNNKNKGKWFYTCQKERKQQCGFFIFEDSAQAREKGPLLTTPAPDDGGPSRAAAESPSPAPVRRILFPDARGRGMSPSTELSTGDELDMASLAGRLSQQGRASTVESQGSHRSQRAQPGHSAMAGSSAKRKLGTVEEDGDADFGGDFDSDEERQMMELADAVSASQNDSPAQAVEPRIKQEPFTTPTAPRTHNVFGGLPTPLTRNRLLIVSEQREAKRLRSEAPTPTTTRSIQQDASSAHEDDYDITEEVMGLLGATPVDEPVRQGVREALTRYALRMRGVERGREIARAALDIKDGKIAELQARVAALENERRLNKERIRAFNTGLEALYQDDSAEP